MLFTYMAITCPLFLSINNLVIPFATIENYETTDECQTGKIGSNIGHKTCHALKFITA